MEDFNISDHFNPESWKERRLEHRAQEDAIHQLQTQNFMNSEDEMKMDEMFVASKKEPYIATFSPPRKTFNQKMNPPPSATSRVISRAFPTTTASKTTTTSTSTGTRTFLKKGKGIMQKKTRYELAKEKKLERQRNKKKTKENVKSDNRFRENIQKWQALDRERWEKGFQGTDRNPEKKKQMKRKNPPASRQKAMKNKRGQKSKMHHFDDMPLPTVKKTGPSAPILVENEENVLHDDPTEQEVMQCEQEEIYVNQEIDHKEANLCNEEHFTHEVPKFSNQFQAGNKVPDHPPAPESVTTSTTTTTFRKKKYPSCSHHVSSLFPQAQHKKPTLARQRKKIMQQQFEMEENTRRLRKEHEEETHQLKEKIKKLNSLVSKYKLNCKNLTTDKEKMKNKLDKFESEQNKNLTVERKEFNQWKKIENKKIKKMQRDLDQRTRMLMTVPNKVARKEMESIKEKHHDEVHELKEKLSRSKAHNESLRRKVQYLDAEIKTLKSSNERLTKANAEALTNHAAKVLRPALSVIAKHNVNKKREPKTTVISSSNSPIYHLSQSTPVKNTKRFLNSVQNNVKKSTPTRPEIPTEYHPEYLSTSQRNSCNIHETQSPIESIQKSQYLLHKYSDSSQVKVYTTGAVTRIFIDGTQLIHHDNGDKEKVLKSSSDGQKIHCYWFTNQQILQIMFSKGKKWVRFQNGEFQEILENGKKIVYKIDGTVESGM